MTTPPLAVPPPSYPPYPGHLPVPPVPPAGRPRNRRAAVTGVVAALVLALAGGTATAWWLLRDDGSPLAGRPRVTDSTAGLSYAVPKGWEHDEKKGLIGAFTSSITTKGGDKDSGTAPDGDGDGHGSGVVLAGRGGPVPQSELKRQTERAARSNAEFFYPDSRTTLEESRETTVSDRPAHTVTLTVDAGKQGTAHLRMTVIAARPTASAFLLGLAQSAGTPGQQEVDAVLASAAVK
ncbi:hypothetical protein [Streptomyces cinnamoneus]|uniref:Uncharacterized protein n=1 Tax=Streptomyces cinnamoneus TaxID=53446 RepID=A0A918TGM9_STRCJ|nr:hypothetical protein [Streptomyces cinnamoneus]GHC45500.1 hypothetical protein GCM10010507_21000 [Streptomyces cinnamoneus]